MAATTPVTPPRSLTELEDLSDSTSSLDSGEWTDLSSAHADDVSDAASLDGEDHPPRPVSVLGAIGDGSEEAWTTADAVTSSSASLYASAHTPLNPFEHEASDDEQHSVREPDPYASGGAYGGLYGPLDPFRALSDADSGRSEQDRELGLAHELELILPDPLERSASTVAADLSFSEDVVLATGPTAIVSLAGAHPSTTQRAAVVADVLLAIAKATNSSCVRPAYQNFSSLSDLPKRVKAPQEHPKEISVLVRDRINNPLTHSHDDAPPILVVFTSDIHDITLPPISNQSILVPIVVNEAAGPVILFPERDDRAPDETAVDVDDLVRQLSNLFAFDHNSDAATQTAVDTLDGKSVVASEYLDEAMLHTDYDTPDEKPDEKPEENLYEKPYELTTPKQQVWPRVVQDVVGPELSDVLKRASRNISPRWGAACAVAVVLSILLGTGHLIQTARPAPSPTTVTPSAITVLTPIPHIPAVQTALAVNSAHTSLALKSQHTSLALKSAHTALAVKSSQTALAEVSHVPINESCSTPPSLASSSSVAKPMSTSSQSSSTTLSSASASTSTMSFAPVPTSAETERAHILANVAEDLNGAMDRIERVLGWNVRKAVGKADAAGKAQAKVIVEAAKRANTAFEATSGINAMDTASKAAKVAHGRHQTARKNAQRRLADIKCGADLLGERVRLTMRKEDIAKENVKGKAKAATKKGKGKEKKSTKGKAKENVKPRPGREKWQTSQDRPRSEKTANKDQVVREERIHRSFDEPVWMWEDELEAYPGGILEEVHEYIHY